MTTYNRIVADGIYGILVTPFDDHGEVMPSRLGPIVDRAVEAGVHNLVINGNTGEFYSLSMQEAERMAHAAAEQIAGRAPLIAGVGRSSVEAARLACISRAAGASALMIHQPPDPFCAPSGVVEYVKRVSDACPELPVLLYLRNDGIGLAAIEALCGIPTVMGVKWACPTPLRLAEAKERCDRPITWINGLAETWAPPFHAVGAHGFTSGLINVWPAHSMSIHTALADGDPARANELIRIIRPFENLRANEQNGANVTVVKAALAMMGNDCGATRPPGLSQLSSQQSAALESLLEAWAITG